MVDRRAEVGRVVIVGGGLAAHHTARQLRAMDFAGAIVVVGDEPHPPYDRPPLSKAVLAGTRDETSLGLDALELGIDLRLGTRATGLDVAGHRVQVETRGLGAAEETINYDRLVIATGTRPVLLPGPGAQHRLRTLDDALALRAVLVEGARVVIVGAGWIGAEVATAALAAGCRVTCLEFARAPSAALGTDVGERFLPWWDAVDLRLGVGVREVTDRGVVTDDGTMLEADVVVSAVGVRACTDWLAGSGLDLDRGVVVDAWLRAAPDVVAVGDVAAWWSARYRTVMRLGHWDNALTGADAGAAAVLRSPADDDEATWHDPVPYFWSDQFGHRIQYVGHHDRAGAPLWRTAGTGPGWSAVWTDDDGRVVAVLAVDRPREVTAARRLITAGASPDPARLADPAIALKQV